MIVPAKWRDALEKHEKEHKDAHAESALDLDKLAHVGNIPLSEATAANLVKLFAPCVLPRGLKLTENAFTIRVKGGVGNRKSWAVVVLPSTDAFNAFLELEVLARSEQDDGQLLVIAPYTHDQEILAEERKEKQTPRWEGHMSPIGRRLRTKSHSVRQAATSLIRTASLPLRSTTTGMSGRILKDAKRKAAGEKLVSNSFTPQSLQCCTKT